METTLKHYLKYMMIVEANFFDYTSVMGNTLTIECKDNVNTFELGSLTIENGNIILISRDENVCMCVDNISEHSINILKTNIIKMYQSDKKLFSRIRNYFNDIESEEIYELLTTI